MWKFVVIILLIAFGYFGYTWYDETSYQQALTTVVDTGGSMKLRNFTIDKGSSLTKIAEELSSAGLVTTPGVFIRYVKNSGYEKNLAAGTFTLHPALTIPEITDILIGKVEPDRERITIPEGYTIRDIIQFTIAQNLFTQADWDQCMKTCDFSAFTFLPRSTSSDPYPWSYLEGYVFPDTYFIVKHDISVQKFIEQMLRNFETRVLKSDIASEITASGKDLHEIIVMASIVEEESTPRDDQAIVAGILWKRIENGVQIAADATNRYIKENPLAPITAVELRSSSPYNTRRQKGLPPTAISSPGLASIKATITPKDSPYWYYLHDNNGQIRFAETEAQHNQNKAIYLQ